MAVNTFGQDITTAGGSIVPQFDSSGNLAPTATYTAPASISSTQLAPSSPITLPPSPTPITPNTSATQATIDSINQSMAQLRAEQQAQTPSSTNVENLFQKYLGSQTPPPSATDTYNTLYNNSGIAAKQQAYTESQNKVNALNAQLAGLNYQYNTTIPNQAQQDATGRGVTAAGLAPITAAAQRAKLLEIAPVQFQTLVAQAEATGNANLLDAAQKHLDTVFQIQSQDAQNQYNYQKSLRDQVYQFATAQEKAKLDAQQNYANQVHSDQQAELTRANEIAKTAMANGQSDIAAKIMSLDPKSPTYRADLATLAGKIVDNSAILDKQYKEAQIAKIYSDLNATAQNGGLLAQASTRQTTSGITYVDGTNLTGKDAQQAQFFAANNKLPYLDKTSADMQNNVETARQNMANIQNTLDGLLPTSGFDVYTKLGNVLSATTQVGKNADALASFNAYRSAAIQALRAMAGAKGLRINQAEIMQSVNQDIPKITDTVSVARAKIAIVNSLLDSQEKGTFGSMYYQPNTTAPSKTASGKSFNYAGAKAAGYSDAQIKDYLAQH